MSERDFETEVADALHRRVPTMEGVHGLPASVVRRARRRRVVRAAASSVAVVALGGAGMFAGAAIGAGEAGGPGRDVATATSTMRALEAASGAVSSTPRALRDDEEGSLQWGNDGSGKETFCVVVRYDAEVSDESECGEIMSDGLDAGSYVAPKTKRLPTGAIAVYGRVHESVAQVRVLATDGIERTADVHEGSEKLDPEADVFVAFMPSDATEMTVVASDASGAALERRKVEAPPAEG